MGLELQPFIVRSFGEFDDAFAKMKSQRMGALVVTPILVAIADQNRRIVDLALRDHLPAIADLRDFTDAGGLMSYGPKIEALYYRAGYFVDKILKGAKPAELPVEQPRNAQAGHEAGGCRLRERIDIHRAAPNRMRGSTTT